MTLDADSTEMQLSNECTKFIYIREISIMEVSRIQAAILPQINTKPSPIPWTDTDKFAMYQEKIMPVAQNKQELKLLQISSFFFPTVDLCFSFLSLYCVHGR